MKVGLRVLIIFIVLALVTGSMFDYVYASVSQDCACCNNKCQGAKSCHETTKACLCSYSAPLPVYLLKSNILPKLAFAGFFTQQVSFSYVYLSKQDIFHPPKI